MNGKFGRQQTRFNRTSDRDRKLFIASAVLAMSLILVLAVVFKFKFASDAGDKTPVVAGPTEEPTNSGSVIVLVPERPIRAGTALENVVFNSVYWQSKKMPEGVILSATELTDKYAKVDIPEGIPITSKQITDEIANATLPLTPGNRAVTINIDAERGLEYHILPGTIVDVVLTHYVGREMQAKVIVEQARVLSLGGSTDSRAPAGGGRRQMRSQTVTLDVSAKDALRIIGSKRLGSISLLLRSQTDDAHSPVTEVTAVDIVEPKEEVPVKRKQCVKGRVKIDGNEFVVHCDGNMFPIDNP
jgi:Flp pilus assembly protein CpaB